MKNNQLFKDVFILVPFISKEFPARFNLASSYSDDKNYKAALLIFKKLFSRVEECHGIQVMAQEKDVEVEVLGTTMEDLFPSLSPEQSPWVASIVSTPSPLPAILQVRLDEQTVVSFRAMQYTAVASLLTADRSSPPLAHHRLPSPPLGQFT